LTESRFCTRFGHKQMDSISA